MVGLDRKFCSYLEVCNEKYMLTRTLEVAPWDGCAENGR